MSFSAITNHPTPHHQHRRPMPGPRGYRGRGEKENKKGRGGGGGTEWSLNSLPAFVPLDLPLPTSCSGSAEGWALGCPSRGVALGGCMRITHICSAPESATRWRSQTVSRAMAGYAYTAAPPPLGPGPRLRPRLPSSGRDQNNEH